MRWVKANERMPEKEGRTVVKRLGEPIIVHARLFKNNVMAFVYPNGMQWNGWKDFEWLDETDESPSSDPAEVLVKKLVEMHKSEIYYRFENDETGYYLSIIDRRVFPRILADHQQDGMIGMIAESVDHLINRTVLAEKDWIVRLGGETIGELLTALSQYEQLKQHP